MIGRDRAGTRGPAIGPGWRRLYNRPPALKRVTGRDLQVLDRSARDVTGRFVKRQVMIRAGDVGRWRGYDENAYPLIAPREKTRSAPATDARPGWKPRVDKPQS